MPTLDYSTTKTSPATLLEAVNMLLRAVGRSSVMSLDPSRLDQTAVSALEAINEESVRVQSKGWNFNTEEEFPAQPNTDGHIVLPASWVRVKLHPRSGSLRTVQRAGKLYDKVKRTFVFEDTVYLNIIKVLPFEDVPPAVRYYIVARAGRIFGPGKVPDSSTYRFTKAEEDIAESEALQADTEDEGNNLPEASPHFMTMRQR